MTLLRMLRSWPSAAPARYLACLTCRTATSTRVVSHAPMCLGAIYWARLRRIYYANTRSEASQIGFDDEFIYNEVARAPELRKIPHIRLLTEEARAVFKEWAASPERIRY